MMKSTWERREHPLISVLTLPGRKARGFLVPPACAMVTISQSPQEAHCPKAFDGLAIRSRVPHGTS